MDSTLTKQLSPFKIAIQSGYEIKILWIDSWKLHSSFRYTRAGGIARDAVL